MFLYTEITQSWHCLQGLVYPQACGETLPDAKVCLVQCTSENVTHSQWNPNHTFWLYFGGEPSGLTQLADSSVGASEKSQTLPKAQKDELKHYLIWLLCRMHNIDVYPAESEDEIRENIDVAASQPKCLSISANLFHRSKRLLADFEYLQANDTRYQGVQGYNFLHQLMQRITGEQDPFRFELQRIFLKAKQDDEGVQYALDQLKVELGTPSLEMQVLTSQQPTSPNLSDCIVLSIEYADYSQLDSTKQSFFSFSQSTFSYHLKSCKVIKNQLFLGANRIAQTEDGKLYWPEVKANMAEKFSEDSNEWQLDLLDELGNSQHMSLYRDSSGIYHFGGSGAEEKSKTFNINEIICQFASFCTDDLVNKPEYPTWVQSLHQLEGLLARPLLLKQAITLASPVRRPIPDDGSSSPELCGSPSFLFRSPGSRSGTARPANLMSLAKPRAKISALLSDLEEVGAEVEESTINSLCHKYGMEESALLVWAISNNVAVDIIMQLTDVIPIETEHVKAVRALETRSGCILQMLFKKQALAREGAAEMFGAAL